MNRTGLKVQLSDSFSIILGYIWWLEFRLRLEMLNAVLCDLKCKPKRQESVHLCSAALGNTTYKKAYGLESFPCCRTLSTQLFLIQSSHENQILKVKAFKQI